MRFDTLIRSACLAACLGVVAGCSTLIPAEVPSISASERQYHDTISMSGRLSIRYTSVNGAEILQGSYEWNQTPQQTSIVLRSPLGQVVARIEVTSTGAKLYRSSQSVVEAADVDALVAQSLGWPLPVAGLQTWLQGFIAQPPQTLAIATPENNAFITADQWKLDYSLWEAEGARPRRIDLSRQTTQAGEVFIRILIDTWTTS